MRLLGLDPEQIGAVSQRRDAVEHAALLTGTGAELVQVGCQALGPQQLSLAADHDVAVVQVGARDLFDIEERVVLVAEVAGLGRHGDLLREAGAERVGAGDDHAIVDAELEERVTDRVDLREEVLVRHGDLAVLVAALLLVGDLVLDLDGAGARLDHLLGQQVRRLGVAEAGVDVGDDRHDVGLVGVDLRLDELFGRLIARRTRRVELREEQVEFTRVGLTEERVQLFDERGDRGLLVHRLVGQGSELAAQGRDHPPREVEVALVRRLQVLLDRDELLLADEAVPDAERLGVDRRVGVVLGHVATHDVGGVLRDLEAGAEPVLRPHAGDGFGVDRVPARSVLFFQGPDGVDVVLVLGHDVCPSLEVDQALVVSQRGGRITRIRRGTGCKRGS